MVGVGRHPLTDVKHASHEFLEGGSLRETSKRHLILPFLATKTDAILACLEDDEFVVPLNPFGVSERSRGKRMDYPIERREGEYGALVLDDIVVRGSDQLRITIVTHDGHLSVLKLHQERVASSCVVLARIVLEHPALR